jgi:histidinol-phosphate aminotransferase
VISIQDIANRELLDLVPYEPGKPVDDVARELGLDPASIVKLASNENPLGPSPLAMAAMRREIERVHFYPDGGGFHLRNAIAEKFGLTRENVVLGNGSNEIIELLFHTFTRPGIHEIVTARHAFAVYTLMAQLFGVRAITVDDVDFTPDLPAMLRAVTPQTRLIFLASPNNPTGTRVTNEALDDFLRKLPPHVIAVLDEAYYEFLDNPPDTIGHVKKGARVVLMRTFSKIQGLAGLRIGYGLAPAEIANLLQRARQPFNANSIAQAGAIAGLADTEHQTKTKAITDQGRARMESAFAEMGLQYTPSAANFVLVHVGNGGEVFQRLMKKGIIVRSMVSYHLPAYIRVSIGTPEQNEKFLAELPAALEGLVAFKPLSKQDDAPLPEEPVSSSIEPLFMIAEEEPIGQIVSAISSAPPEDPKPTPISPPDPGPDVAPERVPVPDPTPNPEREPATPDPDPEPDSEPTPEPSTASGPESDSAAAVAPRATATMLDQHDSIPPASSS